MTVALAYVEDVLLVDRCLTGEPAATRELFRRHRTLYPLAVAHALVALSLAISVPETVLHDMRVGIGYIHFP